MKHIIANKIIRGVSSPYRKWFPHKIPNQWLWDERWLVWGFVGIQAAQSSCPHFFIHGGRMDGGAGRQREKVCPSSISAAVRCRKLTLGRGIGLQV